MTDTSTSNIELRDFISQTIRAILEATNDIQSLADERNRRILYGDVIEFDISLAAIQSENGKKGIGVLSAVLNAGGIAEDNFSTQSTSHVKFSYFIHEKSNR